MEQKQEIFGLEKVAENGVFDHQRLDRVEGHLTERAKAFQGEVVDRLTNLLRDLGRKTA